MQKNDAKAFIDLKNEYEDIGRRLLNEEQKIRAGGDPRISNIDHQIMVATQKLILLKMAKLAKKLKIGVKR